MNEHFNLNNTEPSFVPPPDGRFEDIESNRSKTVAILLSLFLGAFGIHNFYLGYTKKGIIQLVLCLTCILTFISSLINLFDLVNLFLDKLPDADGKKLSK